MLTRQKGGGAGREEAPNKDNDKVKDKDKDDNNNIAALVEGHMTNKSKLFACFRTLHATFALPFLLTSCPSHCPHGNPPFIAVSNACSPSHQQEALGNKLVVPCNNQHPFPNATTTTPAATVGGVATNRIAVAVQGEINCALPPTAGPWHIGQLSTSATAQCILVPAPHVPAEAHGDWEVCAELVTSQTLGRDLTIFFPMGRLWGILTLAMYISPNNGLIDLLIIEEMFFHVLAIHFAV
jgi:hypothetical protein